MEVIERFRKTYKKFFDKSFNKNSKNDMQTMMALAYLINKEGVNLSGRLYFHFKPDEKGFISSEKLIEHIKENKFINSTAGFSDKELKAIGNLYNATKDIENKSDVIKTMAKITYLQSQKGYFKEVDVKRAFIEKYPNDTNFKTAYDALCRITIKNKIPVNTLITKKDVELSL